MKLTRSTKEEKNTKRKVLKGNLLIKNAHYSWFTSNNSLILKQCFKCTVLRQILKFQYNSGNFSTTLVRVLTVLYISMFVYKHFKLEYQIYKWCIRHYVLTFLLLFLYIIKFYFTVLMIVLHSTLQHICLLLMCYQYKLSETRQQMESNTLSCYQGKLTKVYLVID